MKPHYHIIGAGGVGSWLTPVLCLLASPENVTVVDGDTLERKNLDRQLFTDGDIGKNKADALAMKYDCRSVPKWFFTGVIPYRANDWLICCCDNNPARRGILEECDRLWCQAVIAANERTSAEAYYYRPEWRGTKLDPRIYYPEILTDNSADPRRAEIGCTGEAQKRTPQLVTANMLAAGLAGHLIMAWSVESEKFSDHQLKHLEFKIIKNLSGTESFKVRDFSE